MMELFLTGLCVFMMPIFFLGVLLFLASGNIEASELDGFPGEDDEGLGITNETQHEGWASRTQGERNIMFSRKRHRARRLIKLCNQQRFRDAVIYSYEGPNVQISPSCVGYKCLCAKNGLSHKELKQRTGVGVFPVQPKNGEQ